jgi:Uri superfamily endonuclease
MLNNPQSRRVNLTLGCFYYLGSAKGCGYRTQISPNPQEMGHTEQSMKGVWMVDDLNRKMRNRRPDGSVQPDYVEADLSTTS